MLTGLRRSSLGAYAMANNSRIELPTEVVGRKTSILVVIFVALFSMPGCQTVPAPPQAGAPVVQLVVGKLAGRLDGEGFTASFRWQRLAGGGHNIELWGPLGQGRTQLVGDQQHLEIRQGGEVVAQEQDGEGRLQGFTQLGWQVALADFRRVESTWRPYRVTAQKPNQRLRIVIREIDNKPTDLPQ